MTTENRCQAKTMIGRYKDKEIQCCLPSGHDGPHVNNEGNNSVASICMWDDAAATSEAS